MIKNLIGPAVLLLLVFGCSRHTPVDSAHASQGSALRAQSIEPALGVAKDPALAAWIDNQVGISHTKMFANISAPGTARGSVIASPSTENPNYFFFWVRDGALTMSTVFSLYENATGAQKAEYFNRMEDFRSFSRAIQLTNSEPGLGDPRFNADGTIDTLPWGRPQNDGPALRALTFTRFARSLLRDGKRDYVEKNLYGAKIPADTVIKADLEFTAHNWDFECIDLWEEVWGIHFFTRASQYAALMEGAELADLMNDGEAAKFYRETAKKLEIALADHWSKEKGYYVQTIKPDTNPRHQKPTQLDTATILAVLAADRAEGFLSPLSDKMLATAVALEKTFAGIYSINGDKSVATAIGRYSEDHYYGGNPWFLTTAAFAELHYRVARLLKAKTNYGLTPLSAEFFAMSVPESERFRFVAGVDIAADANLKSLAVEALVAKGDSFMARIRKHTSTEGQMDEQISRETGYMVSARDLTWSYASFIGAAIERKRK